MENRTEIEIVRQYLAEIGSKGGKSKSAAKAESSRENGKKGGRPRGSKKHSTKKGGSK
jgi:hypothetical protein